MPKLVIQEGAEAGREITLTGRVVLGREGECAIQDNKISRQHSRIFPDGDGYVVADLNSRNGTLVNGAKVSRHSLRNGDLIQIGNTALRYLTGEEVPAATATATAAATDAAADAPRPSPAAPRPAAAARKPTTVAAKPAGGPGGAEIIWTDGGGRDGAFWEDLGQRNFAYKAGMTLLALLLAGLVFFGVAMISESLFG